MIGGLFAAACLIIIPSTAASASCPRSNCFIGANEVNSHNSEILNADGAYASLFTISNMDVPLSGGGSGTVPNGQKVTGFNVRALQLLDEYSDDFVAIGYTAGKGSDDPVGTTGWDPKPASRSGDTGINPSNGGVYKKVYADGQYCPTGPCYYRVAITNIDVAAGDTHTYQMQRNLVGSTYKYRAFLDGNYLLTYPPLFGDIEQSEVAVLGERLGSLGSQGVANPVGRDQVLNMNEDFFQDLKFHGFGNAGARPPGTLNYQSMITGTPRNDFGAACSVSIFRTDAVGFKGRC